MLLLKHQLELLLFAYHTVSGSQWASLRCLLLLMFTHQNKCFDLLRTLLQ